MMYRVRHRCGQIDPSTIEEGTMGNNPHIIGFPHRFPFLIKMLDLLQARTDVLFTTADDIADWYSAEDSR
ncbi:MAG: hypothetical protein CL731_04595 [Chloroflexi bacterium]|nr:hypothetical protein [Chloroflexota bacterium]